MSNPVEGSLSLFALLAERLSGRLAPIQTTKSTLVDVSHTLEDLVLSERLPAIIFTGFQESSHWREETARYRELAGIAEQICIFAGGTLPIEQDQRQIHVRLRGPDPLRQEWFLLVLTESFAAVLAGRDLQAPMPSESDRQFDTIWSFEPEHIRQTLQLLREVVARERPDRLADLDAAMVRFPPPLPDPHLVTLFTTRLIHSMTVQHQARLHLERVLAYESRLRSLGQVLSGVAHELNNPLQSILGFASLLTEDSNSETASDAGFIVEAAERTQQIVHSLLQLARPSTGTLVATNLAELAEHTLIFVRSDLSANGIHASVQAPPEGVQALINPVRIQQLLINLLANAIQALADQPAPRRITITLNDDGDGQAMMTVADNGPGVPLALRERVFEPFFTTKPVGEGTGLGLSIVQGIVQEHGGTITLQSGPGQGCTFIIRLTSTTTDLHPTTQVESPSGQGTILVVDDDPQVNAFMTRVLTRAGYQVHAVASAEAAQERIAQGQYAAVISDLLMPGMSGVELYEVLVRGYPALARRLIFVTGDATRPTTHAFLEGSKLPYLLKPFTPQQLLTTLDQVVHAVT
ncbi:MAG: ATP-binding protein [Oscillochloridaceae bacterium umkhey_bin13]